VAGVVAVDAVETHIDASLKDFPEASNETYPPRCQEAVTEHSCLGPDIDSRDDNWGEQAARFIFFNCEVSQNDCCSSLRVDLDRITEVWSPLTSALSQSPVQICTSST